MADDKKRDEWEVSNYTQINVDLRMDSPSFRRAMREMQAKIDQDRRGRMKQIDALKDECAIDDILMKHWNDLVSSKPQIHNRAQTTFQAVVNLASRKASENGRLPRPEGALDESQFLSIRSRTILGTLRSMEEKTDKYQLERSLRACDPCIQESGKELCLKMNRLEEEHRMKTTMENYYIPLDSPHASEAKPGETDKPELLNPNRDPNETTAARDTRNGIEALFPMHHGQDSPSAAAMEFANIPSFSYRASRDYISLHPEILDEFESTGLFIVAVETALGGTDYHKAWQLVHQAEVLDRCRALGPDDFTEFFDKVIMLDYDIYMNFLMAAKERYWRILELRDALRERVSTSSGISNNRYVPARRRVVKRSEPEYQFQTAKMGRCGKRGLRISTGSTLGSRPRWSSKSTEALSRKLEMMDLG
ncbi:Hsp90 co-chaperone Cdc37 [Metarhizium anisopliae]|nr:Hsp90 co-chaperone Cdc37 [Metarhizium anisopliae]